MRLKVFTAFSGYDSQCMALERIKEAHEDFDYELVGWSEIDPNAIRLHDANFPEAKEKNYGDISKVEWDKVPEFDLLTYSFPCFPAGALVLTDNGYKNIEDVNDEDNVLTHTNKWQRVEKTMQREYEGDLYRIKAMCFRDVACTPNHPFYVRKMKRVGHENKRVFLEPEWVQAQNLDKSYYLGYAINTDAELPKWDGVKDNRWGHHKQSVALREKFKDENFWYLMGRYVGDGWKKTSKTGSGIIVCCSDRNRDSLYGCLDNLGFSRTINEDRTCTKVIISSNELHSFVDRYGYKAHGKKIDIETMKLPVELLKGFIRGYMDSDGFYSKSDRLWKITSVSRELIYGIAQCVAKCFKRPFSIYETRRRRTTVIEGRVVNQRSSWTITWKMSANKRDKAFFENGYVWFPIRDISSEAAITTVYNMQVKNDESYTANGCIVHNCTDISGAGQQKGLEEGSNTRSSLLWECRKAIEAKNPKYLLMENVKALTQKKFLPYLKKWQKELESYGYENFTQVLNACDYGVPQNRERVFMVSIRNDVSFDYHFPDKVKLVKKLVDVLEDDVDDRYYLSDEAVAKYREKTNDREIKDII